MAWRFLQTGHQVERGRLAAARTGMWTCTEGLRYRRGRGIGSRTETPVSNLPDVGRRRNFLNAAFVNECHEPHNGDRKAGGQECGDLVRPLLLSIFHVADPAVVSCGYA